MFKRKDNDIFGTDGQKPAPRIQNNSYVDPHAAFKRKAQQNYSRYASKLTNTPQSITLQPLDSSNVNEQAAFGDTYHQNRKEADMQSSIFYEPTHRPTLHQQHEVTSLAASRTESQANFGKKETLKREINLLPFNDDAHRGNSSRLFDLDQRVRPKTEQSIQLVPLIPCQMQWDQHDSVRYSHINDKVKPTEGRSSSTKNLQNVEECQSTYFNQEEVISKESKPKQTVEKKEEVSTLKKEEVNTLKKAKSQKDLSKAETVRKGKEPVEIKILRDWDYKLMEGLSKYCKLAGTAIVRFETEEGGKATVVIKRTERWQNVTDWLRKEAKLRIRVINN